MIQSTIYELRRISMAYFVVFGVACLLSFAVGWSIGALTS